MITLLWMWAALAQEVPQGEAQPPGAGVPVEAPAEEAPVEEAPAEEAPAEEAPVEEVPAEEAPAEEAPVEEAPAEEAPAGVQVPAGSPRSDRPAPGGAVELSPEPARAPAPTAPAPAPATTWHPPMVDPSAPPVPAQGRPPQGAPAAPAPVEGAPAVQGPHPPVQGAPAQLSPAPAPLWVLPQMPEQGAAEALREILLPVLPMRGLRNGLLLLLLAVASAGVGAFARRLRAPLPLRGVLPTSLRFLETGSRILVVFFGLGVAAAWLPAHLAPGLPWVVVAGAVAVGWSARDVLPDLIAWLFLSMEGHVANGHWIVLDGRRGQVVAVGMRATRLRDPLGTERIVPNRVLVGAQVVDHEGSWPIVEVQIQVPGTCSGQVVSAAVREAVALCPWAAPAPVEIRRDPTPGVWTIRCAVLEGAYGDDLTRSLPERVVASLGAERVTA